MPEALSGTVVWANTIPKDIAFFHRSLFKGPNRLTRLTIENVQPRLLGRLCDRLHGLAVDGDINEHRRVGNIHVPNAVVHQLVMPLAGSGLEIQRDHAFSKQTVAGTVAAIVIAGRQFHRQKDHSEFFVDADLAPYAGVAGVGCGIVFPGLGTIVVWQRNGVEDPKTPARAHIECADITFDVRLGTGDATWPVGCAYDDYIADHNRRRVESDFAGERIDLLVVILLQVHRAICAKAANRGAGLRVQSDEPVARRHIQDSFLPPVTPISQPAAGELARRDRSSAAFTLSMRPYQFACPRI